MVGDLALSEFSVMEGVGYAGSQVGEEDFGEDEAGWVHYN